MIINRLPFTFILLLITICPFCAHSGSARSTDSVIASASQKYKGPNVFEHILIGRNYRREWSVPVKMPVFDIEKQQGGLEIVELGGGQQTKSLKMKDKNDVEWVLRTVDKDAGGALPKPLRHTFVESIVQQGISASHPYAALTTGALAASIGITAPKPRLFYVPDDPALGEFRKTFQGRVCLLEKREPTRGKTEAVHMDDALKSMQEHNDHLMLQKEVLRARLLDILIGDWDRHAKQWRLGAVDSLDRTYYYLVPVDRDQAYFHSNGLLYRVARLKMPYFRGFKKNLRSVKKLSHKCWNMDHLFLNELSEDDWRETIQYVQRSLSDSVIDAIIDKLPPEVYHISGDQTSRYLKNRRSQLLRNTMKYYRFLSKDVYIIATNETEYIDIQNDGDNLKVAMYDCPDKKNNCKIYERSLDPKHTKRLYLVGFNEQDKISGDGTGNRIRVKKINGKEEGQYNLRKYILAWLAEKD